MRKELMDSVMKNISQSEEEMEVHDKGSLKHSLGAPRYLPFPLPVHL